MKILASDKKIISTNTETETVCELRTTETESRQKLILPMINNIDGLVSIFFILYIQYNHASIVYRSHGVGLLHVQTLLLHHRLHPPLNPTVHPPLNQMGQGKVRLSCPVEMLEKPQLDLVILDLLLASSTSWLTSLKVVLFSKMDASGGWSLCRDL
jgi:hypothetical protein